MNAYQWGHVPENIPAAQLELLTQTRLKGLLFSAEYIGHAKSFVDAHQLREVTLSFVGPTGKRTTIIAEAGQLTTYTS